MKHTYLALLVLLIQQPAWAQFKLTSLSLRTDLIPASRYIRPEDSVKTHYKTTQQRLWVDLGFSLLNKIDTASGKVRIVSGTLRNSYTVLTNRLYEKTIFPDRVMATDIGFSYYRSLRNKWAMVALLSAGVNSDLTKISGKDIFAVGGLIFIKRFSPNFSLGAGLVLNNSLGTVIPWPALTVSWQIPGRFQVNINVPDNGIGLVYNVGISYALSPTHQLAFAFRPRQLSYDIENRSNNERLMSYWELPVGLESRWQFSRLGLFAGGGLMMLRSFQYGEKDISKMFKKYPAHKLAANVFVSTGVQWKF